MEKGYYYFSGDLAFKDQDNNITIVSRSDDQIKIKSNKVQLNSIEISVLKHPLILECCCIGIKDIGCENQSSKVQAIIQYFTVKYLDTTTTNYNFKTALSLPTIQNISNNPPIADSKSPKVCVLLPQMMDQLVFVKLIITNCNHPSIARLGDGSCPNSVATCIGNEVHGKRVSIDGCSSNTQSCSIMISTCSVMAMTSSAMAMTGLIMITIGSVMAITGSRIFDGIS
ncbi:hypothetical protein ACTFIU_001970 [Dictyostelium citrinum]